MKLKITSAPKLLKLKFGKSVAVGKVLQKGEAGSEQWDAPAGSGLF